MNAFIYDSEGTLFIRKPNGLEYNYDSVDKPAFDFEFDVEVDNLWLPDVFGYSAALPQILKKAGVDYFLTQKLSWSQFNDFPYHTFNWRGIDGTEILTHFPPENTYNSELDTEFLLPAQKGFKEKDKLNEFISLFGVGDGGGGPKPENVELGRRMSNLENSPKVQFDMAKNFFERLDKNKDDLETWVGELYLELHRGTLTTHGLVKKQNRKLEWKLRSVEMLFSCLTHKDYPIKELDRLWKILLINQFHDIIPGTSINLVYQTTHAEYEEIQQGCDRLINESSKMLFNEDIDSLVLMNTLSYPWKGSVKVPKSFEQCELIDKDGDKIPLQKIDDGVLAYVELDALSFTNLKKGDNLVCDIEKSKKLALENDLVKYEFDDHGALVSAFDKELQKEFMAESGNILSLYEDRPNNWDAWDVDFFYRDALIETARAVEVSSLSAGSVIQQLRVMLSIGNSKIDQTITLHPHSKRLDFITHVDWIESHKMLRVHFPVNVRSEQASFDIQYGYVRRNTHRNTSWDRAKFEVVGHKYADISDHDNGIALLNDCKYGYMVHDNILDLNLLRSPSNPDPDADKGTHRFTYSLLPHQNDLINSSVLAESACLNQEPLLFEGMVSEIDIPIKLFGEGLELSVFKKAEKEDVWILRIIETLGKKSSGSVQFNGELVECDLMEWGNLGKSHFIEDSFNLTLDPFEIKTFKVSF